MCGPLACSLLQKNPLQSWKASFLYNLGRMLSYCLAGFAVACFSFLLSSVWDDFSQIFTLVLGSLITLSALGMLLNVKRFFPSLSLPAKIHGPIMKLRQNHPSAYCLALGLGTIFLPCMTLHPLLLMSAAQESPLSGALTMFAFFLGTLPAMVSATYMPTFLTAGISKNLLIKIGQSLLLIAGIITIWRALYHH
jgi:sulfite exporter TauE/SafE